MKFPLLLCSAFLAGLSILQSADRKLVMIAGPVSHPPLMH